MGGNDRQLSLFGEPPGPSRRGPVGPAPVPDELRAAAAALPSGLHLGTSSWSFPGWAGVVYDREATKAQLARNGLAAYARHPLLRAVGVDRTFYGPVSAATFAGYAGAVPEDFRFLVKASSLCTSPFERDAAGRPAGRNERFLDAAYAVEEVVTPFLEGLGPKAGPLVFQFPPLGKELVGEPSAFARRLGRFLARLPRGPWYAVELRDRGLLTDDYFGALASSGARHCFSVHPRMPALEQQWRLAGARVDGPLVARWMLRSGLAYEAALERYRPFSRVVDVDPGARHDLDRLCRAHLAAGRRVVVVANNKAEGSAPLSVFALAESLARDSHPSPSPNRKQEL